MKGRQIFNSLLPGVTAAVLTTQPAWADTVTVDNSQVGSYPSVFVTSNSSKDILNDAFKPSITAVDKSYPAPFTPAGVELVKPKPGNHQISGMNVVQKNGVTINAIRRNNHNVKTDGLRATSPGNSAGTLKNGLFENVSYGDNNPSGVAKITTPVIEKKPDDRAFQKIQQIATGPGASEFLKSKSCSQENMVKRERGDSQLQNLLSPSAAAACQRINSVSSFDFKNRFAQVQSPAPVRATAQLPSRPTPESLDPSPNPLQYPTKPGEVKVEQSQAITLGQALEIARRNNQELQVSLLQLKRAQAGVKAVQASLLPTLNLNTQVTRQQTASGQTSIEAQLNNGIPESALQGDDSPSDAFTGRAELRYDLYTSGRRYAQIRQAEEQLRSQELEVERLSEEIRLNVATEYYNLQQADEQVRISRTAVKNAEASLRDARALEEAGVGTRFDSLRTQVNLANSQQQLTNALSQQQIARRQLVNRLNLAQSATITAADPVKLAGLWNNTLENSIVLAYQNRPELQQQIAQRNISAQQRKEALSSLGPQVSLIANYELLDGFNDSVGLTDGYSIALNASLNLFDGGASKARAAQAKADVEIAETQFSQQRNTIRFQVEQSYSQLQSNLENVQTSQAALNQAQESLRLARLRFQAGVGTQLEVLDAENALTQAEGNRINAILDYNRALASLQRAVTSRGLR